MTFPNDVNKFCDVTSSTDFIINDDGLHVPVSSDYLQDPNIKHRLSQDRVIDSRGREFLELCIESQVRILNGRSFGYSQGISTSYKYNGNCVVDYMSFRKLTDTNFVF